MNKSKLNLLQSCCLLASPIALVAAIALFAIGSSQLAQGAAIVSAVTLAVGLGSVEWLKTFRFTAWLVAAVLAALLHPQLFQPFAPASPSYKLLLLLLIQAVMFAMGTQMSLRDFAGVARSPVPVAIGLVCQFTIMPLVGFGLAVAFGLPAEIAAGMVLIGSCSSGLSSNVMAYIARANLALSITLTAVATLLAPLITPFWMKLLAGPLLQDANVELSVTKMIAAIIKIVIVPTGAALIHDYLKQASPTGKRLIAGISLVGIIAPVAMALGGWSQLGSSDIDPLVIELVMWILGGVAFGYLYHLATHAVQSLDTFMPIVAMAGIIYVTGMTTAEGREHLMAVGMVLVFAAALHNLLGYVLGYGMSRLLGLEPLSARTVAFEVGMQNGGMATGLAAEMGKLGTLGLPAAIFIAWNNVSGSLLANFWRRRPPTTTDEPPSSHNELK